MSCGDYVRLDDVGSALICIDCIEAASICGRRQSQVLPHKHGGKLLIVCHVCNRDDSWHYVVLHDSCDVVGVQQVIQSPVLCGQELVEGQVSGGKDCDGNARVVDDICTSTQATVSVALLEVYSRLGSDW